ncbi:2-dehydro-3-deoxyphosphogluconate aldolase / (4S)-4-hydroxy-2-oxoglutarate aldolase [Terrimicrobium sacchariphilum]|jgi:2-dehydro-3-deoxyphosphogluconate aldolase/(4S)-4-hydroxy-2-oxoglutarate aldolase|uniref:2-dehydro-3-deoxy-phosphogluconate aldolase n=1 Tax=Terrimicrobium sacchariphilum TaxID=690879 RepID=A0A146G6P8_TERSA|nr:2-dehydro-3-deoxyphosphogluconate aldolase / (4S)-4-hydroxy-2-oxoglutarate aldolase [Terrimicrobium sacchariphilum]
MSVAFDPSLAAKIEKCGIIAVLIIDRVDDAVPLARALLAGGVNVMELTLRTPAAIDALKAITAEVPEMVAGVGTVLTPAQAKLAKESGAAFAVAPGFNPRVLDAAREQDISFAPGVLTPTDIELAVEGGCKLLKLFPAEPSGGLKYLKAVAAPYAHLGLKYIPLGGLNSANMGSYIADPLVAALGGSWLAPKDLIKAGKWDEITRLAKESTEIIASTPRS